MLNKHLTNIKGLSDSNRQERLAEQTTWEAFTYHDRKVFNHVANFGYYPSENDYAAGYAYACGYYD